MTNHIISGSAMAVIIGAVLVLAPWTTALELGTKIVLTVLGLGFVWAGVVFSKG